MGAEGEKGEGGGETDGEPLPASVVDEAERLTRLARQAVDESEARAYRRERATLLDDHDYEARVREEDTRDVLVCYPAEWLEDGVIQVEDVEDLSRGIEIPLSGPGDADRWDETDAHNRAVAEAVAQRHGDPHGATAAALADFASNHYAKPIEDLTPEECREFREEYLPRNAWPSDAQRAAAEESVDLALEVAEELASPAGDE
jgi:hypothetical protein